MPDRINDLQRSLHSMCLDGRKLEFGAALNAQGASMEVAQPMAINGPGVRLLRPVRNLESH